MDSQQDWFFGKEAYAADVPDDGTVSVNAGSSNFPNQRKILEKATVPNKGVSGISARNLAPKDSSASIEPKPDKRGQQLNGVGSRFNKATTVVYNSSKTNISDNQSVVSTANSSTYVDFGRTLTAAAPTRHRYAR